MIRYIAFLVVSGMLIACPLLAQGQVDKTNTGLRQNLSPGYCDFSFQSGSNSTSLYYCVATNGNITFLSTPGDHSHLFFREGYGICNESPAQAYWDYADAGDSGNWGAATVLKLTATSVVIARTTADGVWTLTQTISLDPNTPAVKIVMALKNNTAMPRVAYLVRYADVDSDGSFLNNFSATTNGAFSWNASIPFGANSGYGLELRNFGQPHFGYLQGFARTVSTGPNPCAFASDSSGSPLTGINGSVALAYVDSVGAKKTKAATIIYRGM